jgi:hypothetical protein
MHGGGRTWSGIIAATPMFALGMPLTPKLISTIVSTISHIIAQPFAGFLFLFFVLDLTLNLAAPQSPFRASALFLFPAFCFALFIFLSTLLSYLNFCFRGFFGHFFFVSPVFVSASTNLGASSSSLSSSESTALCKPCLSTSTVSTVTVVYRSSSMYSSS